VNSFFRSQKLRLVEFNVENLFLYLDFVNTKGPGGSNFSHEGLTEKEWQMLTTSTVGNKPLAHVRAIAKAVRDMNPDIMMLCEVGGIESLANFSKYFLNDEYEAHLLEGNSDRGIDLGYLTRRSLPFRYELESHKHRAIDFLYPHEKLSRETGYKHLGSARLSSHKFSRDVLEFRVFEGDSKSPCLIMLLVHLKSQLDRTRIDPGGRDRRRAELEKLIQIYDEIDQTHKRQVPILLTGDFNGCAALPKTDQEFKAIYEKTQLKDVLEVAGVPNDERFTYMQLSASRNRPGSNKQLDYIFLSPLLFPRVSKTESWVFRYQDAAGRTMLLPRNLNEKKTLPSDHYPVICTLEPETEAP
jgi:Endonuclease/Exonuclease/phosphatase family